MAYTNINKSKEHFNTKLYSGNGTDNTAITGVGFQTDLLWIKERSSTSFHNLQDAVRGAGKQLISNETNAEETSTSKVKSFDSDGFTLGTSGAVNENSQTYASWNWLANGAGASNTDGSITSTVSANTTAGFSIVSYTGNGSANATVGHGLGVTPSMIIVKNRDNVANWRVWHQSLSGSTYYLGLNQTTAESSSSTVFNGQSSTTFTIGNDPSVNFNTENIIAYCFAEKQGFSKFGSYTGNGSTDGTFVYTGFKPAFVIQKRTDSTSNWHMFDNKRDVDNVVEKRLWSNLSSAEPSSLATLDFLSNGFKWRNNTSGWNGSGTSNIYMAFAEAPLVGSNNVPATAR